MTFTENGRVKFVAQPRTGVSSRTGEQWQSVVFVIETADRYPRTIAYTLFGADKITAANLKLGELVSVVGEVESHEYNGNWFSDIRCYDILTNGISRLVQSQMFQS